MSGSCLVIWTIDEQIRLGGRLTWLGGWLLTVMARGLRIHRSSGRYPGQRRLCGRTAAGGQRQRTRTESPEKHVAPPSVGADCYQPSSAPKGRVGSILLIVMGIGAGMPPYGSGDEPGE